MSDAIRQTFLGLVEADKQLVRRAPAPLSHLCVGLKCGGSDGFSGISANPAIGHVADMLAALWAAVEFFRNFPSFAASSRSSSTAARRKEVGDRFIQLMRDYAARAKAVRSGFDMNPSPGNIRDGLVTDAMKSAGAAKKGGTSPVTAVLDYPEYSTVPGLNLQCTPGNDVECVTAQVGAGANIVLFTTGPRHADGQSDCARRQNLHEFRLWRGAWRTSSISTPAASSQAKPPSNKMGETILELVLKVASGEVTHQSRTACAERFHSLEKRSFSLSANPPKFARFSASTKKPP